MTEWLANISIEYVIAAIVVLFIARLALGKYKSPIAKSAAEIVESALMAIALVFLLVRPFVVQAFFIPSGSMLPTLEVHDHILVNKFIYRFREPGYGDVLVFKSPPEATNVQYPLNYAEWNTVIGKVVSPFGPTGDVRVWAKADYRDQFGRIKELCLARENGAREIVGIETLSSDNGDLIIKFSGTNDAAAAETLKGAELRVSEKDYIKRLIGKPGDVIEVKNGALYRNGKRLEEPYIVEPPVYEMEPVTVPKNMLFVMGDNRNDSNDSHKWGPLDRSRVVGKAMVIFWPIGRMGLTH